MNEFHHISSQQELERFIERYFDGMTTLAEEEMLRTCLAHCPWSSPTIDDALMVMGYFATHRNQKRGHFAQVTRQRMIGIAATIAVLLALGGYAIWHQTQPSGVCIAYVNGEVVNANDEVMAMIVHDMNMMDNAADVMTMQLNSMGEAIELDNEQ